MTDATSSGKSMLVITRNLPPLVGGMERLLYNAIRELETSFQVAVIGPDGCEKELSGVHTITSISPYPLWRFLLSSLRTGMHLGRRLRPDVVFAGSGLTAPIALIVSWSTGATSVAQLHGLDLVARNMIYRALFVTTLRRLDAVIVNSRNTAELAASKRIPIDRIHVVHPGISLPGPNGGEANRNFLIQNNLGGKRILLSVGRLTTRKGLSEFIKRCMPDILRHHPNTVLLIAGDAPKDALKSDTSEISKIQHAIADNGLQDQVRLLGNVSDAELDMCYRSSDLFVFPAISVPGDVEGFGIVAIEAAARGIPTVAFAEGGIADAVADGYSGYLVEAGQYPRFTQQITILLDNPGAIPARNCMHHAEKFSIDRFGQQLRSAFDKILAP